MPYIGEIREASEIGYKNKKWWQKYIYHACIDCGRERWVQIHGGRPRSLRCKPCSKTGANHPLYGITGKAAAHWKGGYTRADGYFVILIPSHPRSFADGYVKRAILVLEEKLGRPIIEGYDCHHRNKIKSDDRPENLEEILHSSHSTLHLRERNFNFNEPIIAVRTR